MKKWLQNNLAYLISFIIAALMTWGMWALVARVNAMTPKSQGLVTICPSNVVIVGFGDSQSKTLVGSFIRNGCEYMLYYNPRAARIIHSGSCINPIHVR